MMKSYLRFEPSSSFGAICSPSSNVTFDFSGNLILTGAVEEVAIWNTRQANKVGSLKPPVSNYPYVIPGEVQYIARSNDKTTIAVGYSNGEIRIFNYINKSVVATFKGHRSAIQCLSYDDDSNSSLLASGGKDSDIFIWDMVALNGVCKLRGHKDVVTAVKFLNKSTQKLIISVSKDTLLKVWDLNTQYCIQTIVGHRSEIWSLSILLSIDTCLILTGSSDNLLRGYSLITSSATTDGNTTIGLGDDEQVLEYIVCIERQFGTDKCVGIHFNSTGTIAIAQSSGKGVELFLVRDEQKARKKLKRRMKRMREKAAANATVESMESGHKANSVWNDEQTDNEGGEENVTAGVNMERLILSDLLKKQETIKCGQRVRSCAFSPCANKDGSDVFLLALLNNTLELYKLPKHSGAVEDGVESSQDVTPIKTSIVEMHGHRSDIRAVAVAADGLRVASCSAEGVKLWSLETGSCLSSALCGYAVSLAFAPGGRYIIVGTKEGSVQVVDTASGDIVTNEEDAHKGAVWSISIRPDGKGFASSSADMLVKFWDFTVLEGKLGITPMRELQMTHDALCVRFSSSKSQEKLLVAVGMLDNTIKVFFDDSLKFFLSLYGHKLPVMCLDISYDNTILISGSADKTIKIWGLDFGDCHRSLFAHSDTVTAVRFQSQTHYFFSSGKDGTLKYWDADRFEQILILQGHCGSIWGVDVSYEGTVCVTAGADRTLRVWRRTEDLVFIEEEKERALEAQIDQEAERAAAQSALSSVSGLELTTAATVDSAKGGERLMDAIDLVESELQVPVKLSKSNSTKSNPLLLGKSPLKYMIHVLRQIPSHDLEQALLVLPFHFVRRFISILLEIARQELDIEVCCRSLIFLLRCHESAIVSTQSLLTDVSALQQIIRKSLNGLRSMVGTNIAGLKYLRRALSESRKGFEEADEDDPLAAVVTNKSNKKKKKQRRIA